MRASALLLLALPSVAAQRKCWLDLDLLFVIDGSLSIKSKSWKVDMEAMRTIANNFTFGCTHTEGQQDAEMGIIQFSDGARIEQNLTCDKPKFLSSVSKTEAHQMKGYTFTGDALEAASTQFKTNSRSTSTKVVVMITDGVPCTEETHDTCYDKAPVPTPDPKQAAKAETYATQMKGDGVVFISIAVGHFGTKGMEFINNVSSGPKYVFNPSSWGNLPALISDIVTDICPTPAPTPTPTRCSAELDILFVLDASKSIGPKSWQIDLKAAGQIAGNFTFGCKDDPVAGGAQSEMGIVQFATDVTVPQSLTCQKDEFTSALNGLQEPCDNHDVSCKAFTYTGDAMAEAQKVFKTSGRANSAKVLVLITDGVPCRSGVPPTGEPEYPGWDTLCNNDTGSNCSCFRKLPDWSGVVNTDPQPEPVQAEKAVTVSAAIKKDGVNIVGVAVGDFGRRGKKFMEDVVSQPSSKFLFNPHSWNQLPALVQGIVDSICPPHNEFA